MTGVFLTISTPVGCALFPQQATIKFEELEPALQEVSYTKAFNSFITIMILIYIYMYL